jgi:signal transduction histidine kinase
LKVLVVDDELVSRKTLQKLMESIGECQAVACGEDALEAVGQANLPDLILLDLLMPGIDGYEVCEQLKADPRTKDIPVIFLSAQTKVEDKTRGFELGAVDYVTKPFHKEEVKARVQTHLSIKKMREELLAKNVVLNEQLDEIQEKTDQLRQKDLQLIEMDRAAGIGTLAAGIAHEINNPLSFIKSSVGFLKKSLDKMVGAVRYWDDKPVEEALLKGYQEHLAEINFDHVSTSLDKKFTSIQNGITRIMKIVDSLKVFSKLDTEDIAKVAINQSIEEVIEILNIQESKEVEFVKEFGETPLIECYPKDINQCLLHVIKNALDSLDTTGTIKIVTSHDAGEEMISIRITDNGKGMSPETLQQAFTPFFTTKPVGSGTGVGLSLTERIIKRHGGRIDISSKEGEGTTVTITLPVVGLNR